MDNMFHSSVDAVTNMSTFDVSGVTNLYRTFYSAQNFRGNVERWHLTSITTLQETFRYARGGFSSDMSHWYMPNLQELPATFANTQDFLIDLHWFGSPLKSISSTFAYSKTRWHAALQHKRSNDDGQHVPQLRGCSDEHVCFPCVGCNKLVCRTFYSAQNFRGNVERWHLTSITTLQETFRYARGGFSSTISLVHAESARAAGHICKHSRLLDRPAHWFGSPLKSISSTFAYSQRHGGTLHFNTSGVTTMDNMFHSSVDAVTNMPTFDVSGVTNMYRTFYSAQNFRGNVERWHLTSITTLQETFRYAHGGFSSDISHWYMPNLQELPATFANTQDFLIDLHWCSSPLKSMTSTFAYSQRHGGKLHFNTSGVTTMNSMMFHSSVDAVTNMSTFDVSGVTNLYRTFYSAQNFRAM